MAKSEIQPKKSTVLIVEPFEMLHGPFRRRIGADAELLFAATDKEVEAFLQQRKDITLLVVSGAKGLSLNKVARLIQHIQADQRVPRFVLLANFDGVGRAGLWTACLPGYTIDVPDKKDVGKVVVAVLKVLNLLPRLPRSRR